MSTQKKKQMSEAKRIKRIGEILALGIALVRMQEEKRAEKSSEKQVNNQPK